MLLRRAVAEAVPSVLFLCVHNAGRSQMDMGWFNRPAGGRAVAWSGDPLGKGVVEVRPTRDEIGRRVRDLLASLGVTTD